MNLNKFINIANIILKNLSKISLSKTLIYTKEIYRKCLTKSNIE